MGISESSDLKQRRPARAKRNRLGRVTIVICQNALLWSALYVIASTIFLLVAGAVDAQAIPSAVMYLVAVRAPSLVPESSSDMVAGHLVTILPPPSEYRDPPTNESPEHD